MRPYNLPCFDDIDMDYLSFLQKEFGCCCDNGSCFRKLEIPSALGEGSFQRVQARNSLEIWRVKTRLHQPLTLPFQMRVPRFEICYCRTGHVVIDSDMDRLNCSFSDGNYQTNLMNFSGSMTYAPGIPQEFVSILFYQEFLDSLPMTFLSFSELNEEKKIEVYQPTETPFVLKQSFEKILDCPASDITLLLQLEGMGMEILSRIITLHFQNSRSSENQPVLSLSDKARLEQVRTIIDDNLHRNITIKELSLQVGLNTHKLTSGFRTLYGISLNQYRKDARMKKAEEILLSGQWNISETAFLVGYQSVGHFTNDFRRHYGLCPGEFRKGCMKTDTA
ncbi:MULTISPECIES: AraC family transcriptional regulator [unclassified Oceanispirochaeta]|uniref:helix-turn-helix domain-containing protein n=1 Tax=unclassified Oceanispirochaeta TaxID=2635722 RepID=UPI001314F2A2|nr:MULTISPECIES: AraC family transcriptional regulator [unclassified Oceanispirochaeta]MBF9016512.1 helix-turn-helix transcriptional regulator [Oceanispirochaeta sp. M2]NPD72974.1 helix-turn-helix transcriptional regulator [Oceanispirochaeta sp. M1]